MYKKKVQHPFILSVLPLRKAEFKKTNNKQNHFDHTCVLGSMSVDQIFRNCQCINDLRDRP